MIRNQKGMSSILIILVLVLGISSMAISLAARQNQALRFLIQDVDREKIDDFHVRVRITLENKDACLANFKDNILPAIDLPQEVSVSLPFPDRDGNLILAKSDYLIESDNIHVDSAKLVRASNTKTKFGVYHFVLQGHTTKVPAKHFKYIVPIYAFADATTGKINRCYSSMFMDPDKKITFEDNVCNTKNNTTSTNRYRFDGNTNTCVVELNPDETGGTSI